MKRSVVVFLVFLVLVVCFCATTAIATETNHSQLHGLPLGVSLSDEFTTPVLGTIPLPASKTVNFPRPDGPAQIIFDFPNSIAVGESFDISVTYATTGDPVHTEFFFLTFLFVPQYTTPASVWTETCISPWAPGDNSIKTGEIDSLPSVAWIMTNWDTWHGVGVAPYLDGSLITACAQSWKHGHYADAWSGDTVTWKFSSFVADTAGTKRFELLPQGWVWNSPDMSNFQSLEPISFEVNAYEPIVPAIIDIKPDTLNRRSRGDYITSYIEVPGHDVNTIDITSVRLNGTIVVAPRPTLIEDYDNDGVAELMVKFDRAAVIALTGSGNTAILTVTGETADVKFEGTDTIRILN